MNAIILRPVVNEKSLKLTNGGFYTFEVNKDATKKMVGKVVEDKFKVDVLAVKIINLPAKRRAQRTRKGFFSTTAVRKALVRVKKGQKIALFEQVSEEQVEVRTTEGEPVTKVKEKKSLLRGTKVKIETGGGKGQEENEKPEKSRQQAGKTKGGRI